jgi:ribose 5-phosphate isomerase B
MSLKGKRIVLGSDHAGFPLKEALKERLACEGAEIHDCGAYHLDPSDDYPCFVMPAAQRVRALREEGEEAFGLVLGGSGQGEAIATNKVAGIRAAVWYGGPIEIVRLAREHNDAWVLSLGARFLGEEEAWKAVRVFLTTPFSGAERHQRRIAQIVRWERSDGKEEVCKEGIEEGQS